MYRHSSYACGGYGFRGSRNTDWRQGNSMWTQDYPRADRHFLQALRRLTRIHARSVEQPVNLDDGDDVFNWPWLYAVQVGHWQLTDEQAPKLRDYLDRGGFFMCDDFWGPQDWGFCSAALRKFFRVGKLKEWKKPSRFFMLRTIFQIANKFPARATFVPAWLTNSRGCR